MAKGRVLVVDDEPAVRKSIRLSLTKAEGVTEKMPEHRMVIVDRCHGDTFASPRLAVALHGVWLDRPQGRIPEIGNELGNNMHAISV